ncbi:thioredoxin reductase [Pyrolobus fumarii 1A]|uniref:Thioredoxin reductase n=1 Tax=Pyrolobus fumarii (strain DSM 11204 / 1A) TaxID=694429 RepID=G0EDX9_PYRF1|nr:thioredoxin-disulfide reductase [Pyrolobus fumarii]AEM37895.1 thioredoxin reductase [Pyrolobus fumarii 1A]
MSFRLATTPFSKRRMAEIARKVYDVVIVGGGPAGLTAAIYAARYMLDTILVTEEIGGQIAEAGWVENYPGFPRILGSELVKRFVDHVRHYKVPIILDYVENVKRDADCDCFHVETRRGVTYKSHTVILAVGVKRRRLNVPGEAELRGKGVSYCAPCDAPLFKDKTVAVVGGGDSAASAALLLAEYASKVYIVHRRDKLRVQPIYEKLLRENPKIEVVYNKVVQRIIGSNRVEGIELRDRVTGETSVLRVDGVFVEIGSEPPKELAQRIGLETDEEGYIKVGPDQSTNIPGIFAAGDCTTAMNKYRQVITAAAQGAVAAASAYNYLVRKGIKGK